MSDTNIFIDEPYISEFNVKVIGVGGGALNVLNRFQPKMKHRLEIIGVDTNRDSLNNLELAKKFCLSNLAGDEISDFEMAWNAGRVRDLIEGADMNIVVACLGGETGTKVAPFIANLCKEEGALTIAFVTTPFAFESDERHKMAERGLKELEEAADAVIHIPMSDSSRLFAETMRTSEAFARFDEFVAQCVRGFYDSLYNFGYVCCDLSDAKSVFRGGGKGYAAVGCSEGEGRVEKVLKATLGEENLLLGGVPLKEAKSAWMFIEGGDSLCLYEIEKIVNYVYEVCDRDAYVIWADADVIWTTEVDEQFGEQIRLTLLTSGHKNFAS